MKSYTAEIVMAAGALTAGAVAVYLGLNKTIRRGAERQQMLERELLTLGATVGKLEARLAAMQRPVPAPPTPQKPRDPEPALLPAVAAASEPEAKLDGVEPEMVRVLVAAAAAALGRNVRLVSARLVPTLIDSVSPWSQQGRVFVQTSHNLR